MATGAAMHQTAILIGVMSMLVAFVALYLAGETRRRAEGQTVQFVRGQAAILRRALEEVAGTVNTIDNRLKAVERKAAAQEQERQELAALREDVTLMQSALGALQRVHQPAEQPATRH